MDLTSRSEKDRRGNPTLINQIRIPFLHKTALSPAEWYHGRIGSLCLDHLPYLSLFVFATKPRVLFTCTLNSLLSSALLPFRSVPSPVCAYCRLLLLSLSLSPLILCQHARPFLTPWILFCLLLSDVFSSVCTWASFTLLVLLDFLGAGSASGILLWWVLFFMVPCWDPQEAMGIAQEVHDSVMMHFVSPYILSSLPNIAGSCRRTIIRPAQLFFVDDALSFAFAGCPEKSVEIWPFMFVPITNWHVSLPAPSLV